MCTREPAGFGAAAETDPDLVEWDYGQYEGRRRAEIYAERPDWQLFRDGCPGGEAPDPALRSRSLGLIGDALLCEALDGPAGCVSVISDASHAMLAYTLRYFDDNDRRVERRPALGEAIEDHSVALGVRDTEGEAVAASAARVGKSCVRDGGMWWPDDDAVVGRGGDQLPV